MVTITRSHDYQTWQTFLGEIHEVRKGMWAFFLGCAVRTLIGWTGEVRPHDWRALVVGFSFVFGQASVITSSPRTQPRK